MKTVMKAAPVWELKTESWPIKSETIPLRRNAERNWLDTHKPDSWYQFCTMTQQKYELRGEPVAALMYWSMRYWDESGPVEDPEWNEATNEYWDCKASWLESQT